MSHHGRRRKEDSEFWNSAYLNNRTYIQYYNRLMEMAISVFEWKNLPETVDYRFLELALFTDGMAVYFDEPDVGNLALRTMVGGKFNVYNIPMSRRAYAANGFNRELTEKNSVIIWNNLIHSNNQLDVEMFARRLYNLDRITDINANAQKTPILITCDESQRLSMLNLYKQYDGNTPVIFGDNSLTMSNFGVLSTAAPYVADKIYELKQNIWNEALTYLGVPNISMNKKERLITDEVQRGQGGTIASRFSRLEARKQAADEINRMFGTNIEVNYREDFQMDAYEFTDFGNSDTSEDSEGSEADNE